MYENDGSIGPGGDGGDKYRTVALNLSVGNSMLDLVYLQEIETIK